MLSWHIVTRDAYDAADVSVKTSEKLYFLINTGEIYRGTQSFTESVILYTEEPTVKAVGKLYVNSNTLEGRIWNGSAWTTVIQPVQASLVDTDASKPVSGKAVAEYVTSRLDEVTGSGTIVKAVEYVQATNSLKVTMADGNSSDVPMTNVAADLVYDKTTGLLQVKNASGTAIGTGINLDLERFVSEAAYDHERGVITLSFNDAGDPLEIDIGDLVDTYTAKNSTTIQLTVTGNEFVAEAIVAAGEGYADNLLVKTDKGLYVAPVDLSGKADKVANATDKAVAILNAEGNLVDSKYTLGGATLAAEASASVLATEAAVSAIRTSLQNSIDGKMNKVDAGKAGEILIATEDGHSAVSGAKIGGETMSENPDAATMATEKAVNTFVTGYAVAKTNVVANGAMSTTVAAASDEKVVSEKAVVDAMSWKTTV